MLTPDMTIVHDGVEIDVVEDDATTSAVLGAADLLTANQRRSSR